MTSEGVRAELREAAEIREVAETYLYDGDTDRPLNDGYAQLFDVAARVDALAEQVAQAEQRADDTIAGYKGWTPDDVQRNVSRIVKERDEWIERAQDARAALARAEQRIDEALTLPWSTADDEMYRLGWNNAIKNAKSALLAPAAALDQGESE